MECLLAFNSQLFYHLVDDRRKIADFKMKISLIDCQRRDESVLFCRPNKFYVKHESPSGGRLLYP